VKRPSLDSVDRAFLDLETWPEINEQVFDDAAVRDTIDRRRTAVQMYVAEVPSDQIELETKVSGRMALYWFKRCLEVHEDGRIYGFRALRPYARVASYTRVAEVDPGYISSRAGASGAFSQLLRTYPTLKELIDRHVLKVQKNKHVYESRIPLKALHKRFRDHCRELGLDVGHQYPFNTATLAHRALSNYVRKLIHQNIEKVAGEIYGSDAAKSLQTGDGTRRPVFLPFDRVEADAHHLDAIFCIIFQSIYGDEVAKELHRLWVIPIIEPVSGAILGYRRSDREECNSDDVLRAVHNALTRWEPRELRIPKLQYNKGSGFPSSHNPKFIGACWNEFSVDAALANTSLRVKSQMDEVVGCTPSTLSRHIPNDRPFVEGWFNKFEEAGFHRLPNTTGSNPKDPRRKSPERAAVKYSMQVEDLDELIDVMLANYNGTPTASRGGRSPLEYLEYLCAHHNCWPRQADPEKVAKLLAVRKWVFVRGDEAQGRRPHINFEGVRYTNATLRHAFNLIGKEIAIEIEQDIRMLKAYSEDGAELGPLVAAPPWNRTPHTLEVRRAILAQKSKGTYYYIEGHDPVMDYVDYLEEQVQKGKRVPPPYLEERRMLTNWMQEMRTNGSDEGRPAQTPSTAHLMENNFTRTARPSSAESQDKPLRLPRKAING
jgi:hypothetical protein